MPKFQTVFHGLFIASLLLLTATAHADDTVYLNNDASLCDFYSAFKVSSEECKPDAAANALLGKPRSIHLRTPTAASPPDNTAVEVSIPILFDLGSYQLSPQSQQQLGKMARVFSAHQIADNPILIEGHADASGSDQYNLILSKNRAQAVRDYFVQQHGLNESRFAVEGRGEYELRYPQHPHAEANRRVEFKVN